MKSLVIVGAAIAVALLTLTGLTAWQTSAGRLTKVATSYASTNQVQAITMVKK